MGRLRTVLGSAVPLVLAAGALALAMQGSGGAWAWIEEGLRHAGRDRALAFRWANLGGTAAFFAILGALAVALAAAFDRRAGFLRRLGLRRSALGALGDGACAVGTVFTAYVGTFVRGAFGEPSERLRGFEQLLTGAAGGLGLTVLLVVVLSVGAAFSEELLFRGVLLRRLLASSSRVVAIGLVALAFAAAHADLQHAAAVFPTGLWLTLVAVRSGSLRPAMLGHLTNNLVAASLVAWCGVRVDHLQPWVHALAWLVAFPAFAYGVRRLARHGSTGGAAL